MDSNEAVHRPGGTGTRQESEVNIPSITMPKKAPSSRQSKRYADQVSLEKVKEATLKEATEGRL